MPIVYPIKRYDGPAQGLSLSISTLFMTQTLSKMYTILESKDATQRDAAFDVDELRDIVNYGMSAGVSGFIYTRDCVEWFDANEDEIESYLSDWYHDTMGEDNYLARIAESNDYIDSIDALKTQMVWQYVECKAHDILSSVDPNY